MIGEPKRAELKLVIEGDNVTLDQKWNYEILGIKTSGEASVKTNLVEFVEKLKVLDSLEPGDLNKPERMTQAAGALGISLPIFMAIYASIHKTRMNWLEELTRK